MPSQLSRQPLLASFVRSFRFVQFVKIRRISWLTKSRFYMHCFKLRSTFSLEYSPRTQSHFFVRWTLRAWLVNNTSCGIQHMKTGASFQGFGFWGTGRRQTSLNTKGAYWIVKRDTRIQETNANRTKLLGIPAGSQKDNWGFVLFLPLPVFVAMCSWFAQGYSFCRLAFSGKINPWRLQSLKLVWPFCPSAYQAWQKLPCLLVKNLVNVRLDQFLCLSRRTQPQATLAVFGSWVHPRPHELWVERARGEARWLLCCELEDREPDGTWLGIQCIVWRLVNICWFLLILTFLLEGAILQKGLEVCILDIYSTAIKECGEAEKTQKLVTARR